MAGDSPGAVLALLVFDDLDTLDAKGEVIMGGVRLNASWNVCCDREARLSALAALCSMGLTEELKL